jgi:hypothetical protein
MESFERTLSLLFTALAAAAAVILAMRLVVIARRRRQPSAPLEAPTNAGFARILLAATLILFVGALFHFTTIMLPLAPAASVAARLTFHAVVCTWLVLELLATSVTPRPAVFPRRRAVLLPLVGSLGFGAAAFFLVRSAPGVHAYPSGEEVVRLRVPVEGRWLAAHAGASSATNHHNRLQSQRFAADLVRLGDDGRIFADDVPSSASSYTWDQPVHAPAAGRVAVAVDGFDDDVRPTRREDVGGNYVSIEIAPRRYVILAHFRKGSIAVSEGEHVAVGQLLGRAGNSGNSDFPHVHLHVQDRPSVDFEATAYPYRFEQARRKRWLLWRVVDNAALLRNDMFEAVVIQ